MSWASQTLAQPSLEAHLMNPLLLPAGANTSGGRRYITCYDPATAMHITTLPADTPYEIGEKIGEAGRAQIRWKGSSFAERRRVVRSLMKWLLDNRESVARVACRDTGKTSTHTFMTVSRRLCRIVLDAALGEIMTTLSKMEWLIKHGEVALRPDRRHGNLILSHKTSTVYYEPLGVIAAIVSWNYPLHNAFAPVLAGIFAGNSVVVKCSEHVA